MSLVMKWSVVRQGSCCKETPANSTPAFHRMTTYVPCVYASSTSGKLGEVTGGAPVALISYGDHFKCSSFKLTSCVAPVSPSLAAERERVPLKYALSLNILFTCLSSSFHSLHPYHHNCLLECLSHENNVLKKLTDHWMLQNSRFCEFRIERLPQTDTCLCDRKMFVHDSKNVVLVAFKS